MAQDTKSKEPDDRQPTGKAHEDDVLVVPKGSSRSRFIMTALLAVLVLTTFSVSGEVVDSLTGRGASGSYMSWKGPDGSVHKLTGGEFIIKKQNMSKAMGLLSGGRNTGEHDDSQTAQHILADELAQDAGIFVTNAEMSKIILSVFGTTDVYKRRLADFRTSAKEFEETLRSIMRVRRYEMLMAQGFSLSDPKDVERHWTDSHQEYSIQTIELGVEGFAAEAAAACPAGDELEAWFNALPEAEKSTYRRQGEPKTGAEFAWFSLAPLTGLEQLLAKYPRPATENADEVARTWYEANKELLYLKPDLEPGKPRAPEDYKPFEEVADHARNAGIAYQSILDMYNEMKLREGTGEKIMIGEEGMNLGFGYRQEASPHTYGEWGTIQMAFQGQAPIQALFDPTVEVTKLLPEVYVDAKGIFIGRLLAREEGGMPAFAEFQDKVREGWIKKKKADLAQAKLTEFAAKFPEEQSSVTAGDKVHVETDDAKFQAAAQELGLEVKTQEWLDPSSMPETGQNTPFHQFVRRAALRQGKTPGALSPPEISPDRTAVWIARVAGKRDPSLERMTPAEFESAKQMATYESRTSFLKDTFLSDEFLKEHYALDLEPWRRAKEAEGSKP